MYILKTFGVQAVFDILRQLAEQAYADRKNSAKGLRSMAKTELKSATRLNDALDALPEVQRDRLAQTLQMPPVAPRQPRPLDAAAMPPP